MPTRTWLLTLVGVVAVVACAPRSTNVDAAAAAGRRRAASERAEQALAAITIPDIDDVRGNVTLPTTVAALPGTTVRWTSSDPKIMSDRAHGAIAAGEVRRPPVGAAPAKVTLSACITVGPGEACRDFVLTVRPAVSLAPFTRYGMVNFARSNSQAGQQIYIAASVGNDPTRWVAVNGGHPVLESRKGMRAVRDPSIVRSPEGDRFYLVATDLNVDGRAFGWQGWDWAQSGASRAIEVWESDDLRHWSEQRHVLVAPAEAGMAFAPEAIWDSSIGAYVVYWTSSLYLPGTHYTTDRNDPKRRFPLTRNQTLYSTTRDFVTFTPARVMSGRPGHGTLDAAIIGDDSDGHYYRFVTDRTSTGVGVTKHVPSCGSEDIYQERARSVLAPPEEWQLVAGCITHRTMNTTYAEAPMVVEANPGDVRGKGYYLWADQKWAGSPSGSPMEEQLSPYWSADLVSGRWLPIDWAQKPDYDLARGVLRHGHVFALTQAEHAALRGADLLSVSLRTPPTKTTYAIGEPLDLRGLVVTADYTDGVKNEVLVPGYGGYSVSGYDPKLPGTQTVTVSYTVVGRTKTASFQVVVDGLRRPGGALPQKNQASTMLPRYRWLLLATLPLLAPVSGRAQNAGATANSGSAGPSAALPVTVRVEADREIGPLPPVWRFFGADEPNFATMKDGRLLLAELGALRPGAVYFRAHNLLTSGDGTPALKWGSTNAYTEDEQGRPVYDWTIVDRILDSYLARHVRPYVEIGFMPEALSTRPQPYQHDWRPGAGELYTGWSYPPKDHDRWGELVYRWVDHLVQRYGRSEVESWYFQTWNEPNIGYWHGTRDQFFRLSDVTIAAVRRALPTARIAGPHMAGSDSTWLTAYLRHTLPAAGAPRTIDVVAFHAKGNPRNVSGHVVMGMAEQLVTMDRGFATVAREAPALPIVIGESDPEGCAACKGPALAYRNGTLYSSYEAASIAHAYDLASRRHVTLEGVLTWAFEFEDQGYFPGFRVLASAGIDHPVLNVFRFLSKLPERRTQATSSGALPLDSILAEGVRGAPDVGALAARDSNRVAVLLWNYHDDDLGGQNADLSLTVAGLPRGVTEVTVTQQRIDSSHGNAYAAWLEMGSPIAPSEVQRTRMKVAAAATQLGQPQRVPVVKGAITVPAALERQGVGLVQVEWGKATGQ